MNHRDSNFSLLHASKLWSDKPGLHSVACFKILNNVLLDHCTCALGRFGNKRANVDVNVVHFAAQFNFICLVK